MKQLSYLTIHKTRLFKYINSILTFTIFLLIAIGCGGDDDPTIPTPPPTKTTVSKKYKSDREGEIYRGYLNGTIKATGTTNNAETTAELKITTTSNKQTNKQTIKQQTKQHPH